MSLTQRFDKLLDVFESASCGPPLETARMMKHIFDDEQCISDLGRVFAGRPHVREGLYYQLLLRLFERRVVETDAAGLTIDDRQEMLEPFFDWTDENHLHLRAAVDSYAAFGHVPIHDNHTNQGGITR